MADAQEWVHAAAEYFLVEGETAEEDRCHLELTPAALGWEHRVLKAGEAFQAFGSVVVVVEEVTLVLMVVVVEKTLQVSESVVEEGTLVLGVADEETLQVFGAAVAEQEEIVVSVDQVG